MKSIWEDVKPFSYPQKGANGCYNYGYRSKKRSLYKKLNRRIVYRQIRHYGFDTSETWVLCDTIMRYLSDNVGGFFRECGNPDNWDQCTPFSYKEAVQLEKLRQESYKEHLKEYLESLDEDNYHQFLDFVIPRLVYLEKHFVSYPAKFDTKEEWRETLNIIIDGLEEWNTKPFVEYFFYLWD